MFTGIVSHLGKLQKVNQNVYTFSAPFDFCQKLKIGTSVAVNGACLTVFKLPAKTSFSVEIMPETARKTMFSQLKINDLVNLELPVTTSQLLSGHILTGHVDGVAKIKKIEKEGNSKILTINTPPNLGKYIVEKGAIALNGISLTVIDVGATELSVGIIPYTLKHTMLQTAKTGTLLNIEVDILAKYLEKLLKERKSA